MLNRNQSGDTLVEVAIAMAILGAVIATAYAVSNKAVQMGLTAKERVQAAQLQQYQAEALRSFRDNALNDGATTWDQFRTTSFGVLDAHIAPPADADACNTPAFSAARFYLRINNSSHKWIAPNSSRGAIKTGVFTECVIASTAAGDLSRVRFDIFITWPGIGSSPDNRSVITTYLEDTKGIKT